MNTATLQFSAGTTGTAGTHCPPMPRPVPALLKPSGTAGTTWSRCRCCQYRRTRHLFRPPTASWANRRAPGAIATPKAACCSTSAALSNPKAGKNSVRYRCGWMPVCCAGNGKASRNRVRSTGWIYSRLNLMRLSLSTRVKRPLMLPLICCRDSCP